MTRELNVIGKSLPIRTADAKVKGQQAYISDTYDKTSNTLIAKTLKSPYAHAKIKRIDTSAAEALPGVAAVISYKDMPQLMPNRYRCAIDNFEGPGLSDHQKFVGDLVAAVAATSEEIALKALDLIEVEYEELDFVLDEKEATEPGAPVIREWGATNNWHDYEKAPGAFDVFVHEEGWGEPEQAFAGADVVLEGKFTKQPIWIGDLEPLTAIAWWQGDKLTIKLNHQCPHEIKESLAIGMGIKMNQVRVIIPEVIGGTFGITNSASRFEVIPSLLSRKAGGYPVKYKMTREEMILHKHRDGNTQFWKMAANYDGTLVAVDEEHYINNGGWGFKGHPYGHWYYSYYQVPNLHGIYFGTNTNKVSTGCHRGVGALATNFGGEQMIDMLAGTIGMDPIEFRKKNCTRVQEMEGMPYGLNPNGIWSEDFDRMLDAGAERIGWAEKFVGYGKPYYEDGPRKRGVGCSIMAYLSGVPTVPISAIVEIERDGTAKVIEGQTDLGTSSKTTMAMIAAEALGFKAEDVRVCQEVDTDGCSWAPMTGSSMTGQKMGATVKLAALDARNKLLNIAAGVMEVSAEDLEIVDSIVVEKNNPANTIPVHDLIHQQLLTVIGTADYHHVPFPPLHLQTGACFADVEVNTDTGEVKVLDIVLCHDSGQPLNKAVLENQVFGGLHMGFGHCLMESSLYDPITGRILNPNMIDHKLPTTLDIPHKADNIYLSENLDTDHAFGAKSCGEGPAISPSASIANAVHNAIGVRIFDEGLSPDKILKALGKV